MEFKKKGNAHLHDFCSSILRKQDEGILPIFPMQSIQTRYLFILGLLVSIDSMEVRLNPGVCSGLFGDAWG